MDFHHSGVGTCLYFIKNGARVDGHQHAPSKMKPPIQVLTFIIYCMCNKGEEEEKVNMYITAARIVFDE